MLDISKQIFEEFRNREISYCHFKSNEHLKQGLLGLTDLDILVSMDSKDECVDALVKTGFKQFEPVKVGTYPGVQNWYGYDKKSGKLIHLHLHFQLITGKGLLKDYILPWSEIVLDNAIRDDDTGVFINDPNLEYILLCTRIIVKRRLKDSLKSIGDKIYLDADLMREINYLKGKINYDILITFIHVVYPNVEVNKLYNLLINIEHLSNRQFNKLNRIIRKELRNNRRCNSVVASVSSFRNRLERSINRKLNKKFSILLPVKKRSVNRAVSIAFVGIDGSGKSTVSSEINKWLASEFDAIKFYAGAGDGKKNIFASILLDGYSGIVKIKQQDRRMAEQESCIHKRKSDTVSVWLKLKHLLGAMVYYKILKDNYFKIKRTGEYTKKGCFCIMDRYPQSHIESDHDGPKVSKYLKHKPFKYVQMLARKEKELLHNIENATTKFDLLFKLIVDPNEAHRRKPDHDYQSMKRRAESLQKIKFSVKETVEIDANASLEEVILAVKEKIWSVI